MCLPTNCNFVSQDCIITEVVCRVVTAGGCRNNDIPLFESPPDSIPGSPLGSRAPTPEDDPSMHNVSNAHTDQNNVTPTSPTSANPNALTSPNSPTNIVSTSPTTVVPGSPTNGVPNTLSSATNVVLNTPGSPTNVVPNNPNSPTNVIPNSPSNTVVNGPVDVLMAVPINDTALNNLMEVDTPAEGVVVPAIVSAETPADVPDSTTDAPAAPAADTSRRRSSDGRQVEKRNRLNAELPLNENWRISEGE